VQESATQDIYVYIDDSGVFHPNSPRGYFIYGGYVFLDKGSKTKSLSRYKKLSREINVELGRTGELKAFGLATKHKRALFNIMKNEESFCCVVRLSQINKVILDNKLSIHRYKDYALKIAIKRKLEELISETKVQDNIKTNLCIMIDEQHTASNGYYKLQQSIYEELRHGIKNFDYGVFHPPIFTNDLTVSVMFCDSSKNPLVQASDILANRFLGSFTNDNEKLRRKPNHKTVEFP
jgi:hypothetical protein